MLYFYLSKGPEYYFHHCFIETIQDILYQRGWINNRTIIIIFICIAIFSKHRVLKRQCSKNVKHKHTHSTRKMLNVTVTTVAFLLLDFLTLVSNFPKCVPSCVDELVVCHHNSHHYHRKPVLVIMVKAATFAGGCMWMCFPLSAQRQCGNCYFTSKKVYCLPFCYCCWSQQKKRTVKTLS